MLMEWGTEPDPHSTLGSGNRLSGHEFLDAVFPEDPGTHLLWDGREADRELAKLLRLEAPGLAKGEVGCSVKAFRGASFSSFWGASLSAAVTVLRTAAGVGFGGNEPDLPRPWKTLKEKPMPGADIISVTVPEEHLEGKRLGRHVKHDPRSWEFQAGRATKIVSVTHQATGLPLDQGKLGSCTANALCGALDSAPDFGGGTPRNETDAIQLYELETNLEGKPYPPNDPGGSGLMVCKAAKQLGMITAYHHAFGIQHALQALVVRPVITGINWYTSFDNPNPQTGLVELTAAATVRGGHEIVADGIDADKKLVWFWNRLTNLSSTVDTHRHIVSTLPRRRIGYCGRGPLPMGVA